METWIHILLASCQQQRKFILLNLNVNMTNSSIIAIWFLHGRNVFIMLGSSTFFFHCCSTICIIMKLAIVILNISSYKVTHSHVQIRAVSWQVACHIWHPCIDLYFRTIFLFVVVSIYENSFLNSVKRLQSLYIFWISHGSQVHSESVEFVVVQRAGKRDNCCWMKLQSLGRKYSELVWLLCGR